VKACIQSSLPLRSAFEDPSRFDGLGRGYLGFCSQERAEGSECRWARVLAYDPPDRLLLSSNISPSWQVETDQARTSEREVRFVAETESRTGVEIEHRELERHSEGWEGVRSGGDADQGWPLYLQRYAALFAR
jgi:hypothetical protein